MTARKRSKQKEHKTLKTPRKHKHTSAINVNRRQEENRRDAFAALALMRRKGLSASSAAEAEGTTVKNIVKYARPALRKRGKEYFAKPSLTLRARCVVIWGARREPRQLHEGTRSSDYT